MIVATGVSYRRLEAAGLDELTGRGVYYGATASDASQCEGDDVYIVGAANSAGQAALNIARYAKRVVLVVRADSLENSMSQYLVERIAAAPNIEVRLPHRGARRRGDGHLEALTLADRDTGANEDVPANWLFVFIGASPRTEWLGRDVARDDKGFVVTGQDLLALDCGRAGRGPAAVRARDERARRVRGRRRAARLDEAGRLGRRRGRHVGLSRPPLPGDDLMQRRATSAACASSTG